MVDRDGYRGVGRPSFNVKTIRINSYFPPIFSHLKFLFSYFFDPGSRLTPLYRISPNMAPSLIMAPPLFRAKNVRHHKFHVLTVDVSSFTNLLYDLLTYMTEIMFYIIFTQPSHINETIN